MYNLLVPTINGDKAETVYNINDFPYGSLEFLEKCKTKRSTFYNVSCAFDIESTTIEPPYEYDKHGKKLYLTEPYGFMYHWQFCINKCVVFGRTWEEFQEFLKNIKKALKLNEKTRLVIYVHNLSYEFQFMKEFIKIESIFARDKRKVMKVNTKDGFEFRCSYFLSNMNLAKFCENSELCTHYKLIDEYDYSKIRTPKTELTSEELAYCYNDVRGLCECIDTMLQHDTIASIPLTNTGYVRRDYREVMKTKQNRYNFVKTQLNVHDYTMLRRAFRGGNTHANRFKADVILKDVYSFDISSSYPSCIEMDDFPLGKFNKVTIKTQRKLDYFCKNYCVVMEVEFFNIEVKKGIVIPYVDIAHCYERSNIKNDNGRILKADYVKLTITNIDLDIIRKCYNFEGFHVLDAIYSEKGKLPIELRKKLMDFYTAKTQLKGVEGKEYEYMKSKNRLNATFGMMVTDVAHTDINYDVDTMEWSEVKPDLEGALQQFYQSRNNFLSYQWGVFVTANARKRLQDMLDIVGEDVVYIDTDSIKFVNKKHIAEFEELNEKLKIIAEENDVKAYVDRKENDGTVNRFYLGTWDNDGNYNRFKTLGAKKYCYEKTKKGDVKFEITVSGMNKKKGAKAVKTIENFKIGQTFHDVGRTVSWYNDEQIHEITINGDTFTTASNIGIVETTYTLGVTNEYWELIGSNGEMIL